jgi:hypothetical protein
MPARVNSMMPYIVTTRQKRRAPVTDERYMAHLSTRAVATLEEAHRICDDAFAATGLGAHYTLVVPGESGGTVGPLPDGTVIEVERVTYDAS